MTSKNVKKKCVDEKNETKNEIVNRMILFSLFFFRPIFTNKFVAHKIESPKVPTYTTGTIGVLLSFSDDDDDDVFF